MTTDSANEYLLKYGWMALVVAIVGGATVATVYGERIDPLDPTNTSDQLNKSQIMQIVERGAGQKCEWSRYNGQSGRIDCIQKFNWQNQSYKVHDYFDVEFVNGTVEITQ